jgi:hypothetical protein
MVLEKVGRVDEFDAFAAEFVGDAADERVGVAAREAQEHLEHAHVRQRAAENLHVLDLPGHDRALYALAFEETDHPPQLSDADPLDATARLRRHALNCRIGLLADRRNRQRRPRPPRPFKHEKRKLAVACDESVTHKRAVTSDK